MQLKSQYDVGDIIMYIPNFYYGSNESEVPHIGIITEVRFSRSNKISYEVFVRNETDTRLIIPEDVKIECKEASSNGCEYAGPVIQSKVGHINLGSYKF